MRIDPDPKGSELRLLEQYLDYQRETMLVKTDGLTQAADLDQLSNKPLRDGQHFSLRWVLLHLIEETSRHAGHADFLREAVDGAVGE